MSDPGLWGLGFSFFTRTCYISLGFSSKGAQELLHKPLVLIKGAQELLHMALGTYQICYINPGLDRGSLTDKEARIWSNV